MEDLPPDELEAMYLSQHAEQILLSQGAPSVDHLVPITPEFPESVIIQPLAVHLLHPQHPISLRIAFRKKSTKTNVIEEYERIEHVEEDFLLSYHSIMFDFLKIDVYEHKPLYGMNRIGKVRLKFSKLPSLFGEITKSVDILPKHRQTKPGVSNTVLGTIEIRFIFHGGNITNIKMLKNVERKTHDSDASESEYSSSVAWTDTESIADDASVTTFMSYFESAAAAGYESSSSVNGSGSDTSFASAISFARSRNTSADRINSGSSQKYSNRPGKVFSERTKLGLREMSEFAVSFFKSGWKLSKFELVRSLMFFHKFCTKHALQPLTDNLLNDPTFIKISLYWLNYTVAAYGPFVINWCGQGSGLGFLGDKLRPNADMKSALSCIGIPKEDMLVWEFGSEEAFKPNFFICRDQRTDSIVLSIRGTWSMQDAITDLCGEYQPYRGGYVHRGFLRSAKWIEEHYLAELKRYVSKYKAQNLCIVGHSLGGSIAALFSILIRSHEQEFVSLSPKFRLRCFTYGCPPCMSEHLADSCKTDVYSFVNETDIVPRLGYGAMSDLREMIVHTAEVLKLSGSEKEKIQALEMYHKSIIENSEHPKVYIPGNVYYIYKTSRAVAGDGDKPYLSAEMLASLFGFMNFKDKGHYAVEKSDKKLFLTIPLRSNVLFHHFPDRYEKGLRGALDAIENKEKDEKRSRSATF